MNNDRYSKSTKKRNAGDILRLSAQNFFLNSDSKNNNKYEVKNITKIALFGKSEEKEEKTNVNIKCLYVCKYNIYSLQKLTKDNGYSIDLPNGKFKFNFCKNLESLESTSVYTPKKNTSKSIY